MYHLIIGAIVVIVGVVQVIRRREIGRASARGFTGLFNRDPSQSLVVFSTRMVLVVGVLFAIFGVYLGR
jgi:hypothetical protein